MIIAEVGLNHLGSFSLAKKYIEFLKTTDVQAVTFQVREKDFYLRKEKKHLSLDKKEYMELCRLSKDYGKQFGVAIADLEQINFFESIGTDFYKIIRNDMKNDILVSKLIETGKKVIVSTGLSSEKDIETFVKKYGKFKTIVLNHTQLSYKTEDCNLVAIQSMRDKYNTNVSFGSHCSNQNVLYMSLCYHPSDILFYVKVGDTLEYPDDRHAVSLKQVPALATDLRNLASAVGTGQKLEIGNKIKEMAI